jgi:hypothetical protein
MLAIPDDFIVKYTLKEGGLSLFKLKEKISKWRPVKKVYLTPD